MLECLSIDFHPLEQKAMWHRSVGSLTQLSHKAQAITVKWIGGSMVLRHKQHSPRLVQTQIHLPNELHPHRCWEIRSFRLSHKAVPVYDIAR